MVSTNNHVAQNMQNGVVVIRYFSNLALESKYYVFDLWDIKLSEKNSICIYR